MACRAAGGHSTRQISFLHYCLTQALLQSRWLPTETAAEDALQLLLFRTTEFRAGLPALSPSKQQQEQISGIYPQGGQHWRHPRGLGEQTLEALMSRGLESVSPGQLEPMTHALALLAVLHTEHPVGWVCRRLGSNQHAEKRKARFQASQAVGTKVWDVGHWVWSL